MIIHHPLILDFPRMNEERKSNGLFDIYIGRLSSPVSSQIQESHVHDIDRY